jgi:hypothetical protein
MNTLNNFMLNTTPTSPISNIMKYRVLKMGMLSISLLAGWTVIAAGSSDPTVVNKNRTSLEQYVDIITSDLLYQHLSILASDEMEGRNTGSVGIDKAAEYLAQQYAKLGLVAPGEKGSYFQTVPFMGTKVHHLEFSLHKRTDSGLIPYAAPSPLNDANVLFTRMQGGKGITTGDIVFAGFGAVDTTYGVDPFGDIDIKGAWVLLFQDLPHVSNGDTLLGQRINNQSRLLDLIIRREAAGVILIDSEPTLPFEVYVEAFRKQLETPGNIRFADRPAPNTLSGGYLRIHPNLAAHLLGVEGMAGLNTMKADILARMRQFKAQTLPFSLTMSIDEQQVDVPSRNVMAYLEGSDPVLKDEIVVLSSHYDHVGISLPDANGDYINNGADDDGSGTAGVLAVATAFARAAENGYRPRRSILFLNVTAEEKGLLGSRYYSDNPVFPIEKHIANINMDMIGRDATEHEEKGIKDGVYIIGASLISSTLDSLLTVSNAKTHNLYFDMSLNNVRDPQQIYRRSDHWNFGRLGIPFVFYFTGIHEDYHRPSDEVDKINFEKFTKITQLIYQNTLEIANSEKRPLVDNQEFIEATRQSPRN